MDAREREKGVCLCVPACTRLFISEKSGRRLLTIRTSERSDNKTKEQVVKYINRKKERKTSKYTGMDYCNT